jgi:hypothetical protein
MAARKPARGRGAKVPRPRFRTSAANAKARALHKALIKSAEKPAKKRPTATADAKKAPKKTAAPKRLKNRFKVGGLVTREGNTFDHTKAVHNVLMAAWTDRLMMSSDGHALYQLLWG